MIFSGRGRAGGAGSCPTVGAGIVSPAGVQNAGAADSAPDDHFAAGPHCRVKLSGSGRAGGAGSNPVVGAGNRQTGAVSPAGVQIAAAAGSAPDDHFGAGPHCRVKVSGSGRAGGAGSCPTVGAGIVSPAGVKIAAAIKSAPDDHFAAGPHCRVIFSGSGRVGGARGCPRVVCAANRRTGYHRKCVVRAYCRDGHRDLRFGFSQP